MSAAWLPYVITLGASFALGTLILIWALHRRIDFLVGVLCDIERNTGRAQSALERIDELADHGQRNVWHQREKAADSLRAIRCEVARVFRAPDDVPAPNATPTPRAGGGR